MRKVFQWCGVLMLVLAAQAVHAQSNLMVTTVATFYGTNGSMPSGLLQAKDGLLYGTTAEGGAFNQGTVFKTTLDGAMSTIISFDGTNGAIPCSLVQGPDRDIYGVANLGANGFDGGITGYGRVFQISSNGTFDGLFAFDGTNGSRPNSLTLGRDGVLYGITSAGGTYTNDVVYGAAGYGTVFKLTTNGVFALLTSFEGANGKTPRCLISASDGNFYGTADSGGTNDLGTIFKITTNGNLTSLFSFSGSDGSSPDQIIQASDGFIYGMTINGGSGNGTVFRVSTNGEFTSLFSFPGSNGGWSGGKLLEVRDGVFFGTTYAGGLNDDGTVFQVTTNGSYATLLSFDRGRGNHSATPLAGLVRGQDGNSYGVCQYQGFGSGGVYCIRPLEVPSVHPSIQDGQISLAWNVFEGCGYSIQYKTNLLDAEWQFLFYTNAQANGAVSYVDSTTEDSQRFYNASLIVQSHWW